MSTKQIMFYATALDLGSVMFALESETPLQYTRTGLFGTDVLETYLSYADIPGFGVAVHPNAIGNPGYLVSIRETEIRACEVSLKTGEARFSVDQLENEDTVTLRPGGRYGDAVILYGMIGTVSSSAASKNLLNRAGRELRKRFTKRREFLLGPEARDAWKSGVRLTVGALSPTDVDLKHE